jgi:methyltransferase (TIGR00027 family)
MCAACAAPDRRVADERLARAVLVEPGVAWRPTGPVWYKFSNATVTILAVRERGDVPGTSFVRDDRPSTTAQWVAAVRAASSTAAANHALDDPYAGRLLRSPFTLLLKAVRGPLGPLVYRALSSELRGNICARTRYFDAKMKQALDDGCTQVVILGAGYDTRALRLARNGVRFFEVDHPATQADKRARLASLGLPIEVTFVAVDFTRDALAERLQGAGFTCPQRTFFLWEGVTMYLDETEVRTTLRMIRSIAAPQSLLSFDVNTTDDRGRKHRWQMQLARAIVSRYGEPWKLWMTQANVPVILRQEGWRLAELLGAPEIAAGCLPDGARLRVPAHKCLVLATSEAG